MQRLTVIHGGTNYFSCRLNDFSLSLFNDNVAAMVRDAQNAPHRSITRDGYIVEVDEVDTDGIDVDTEDMCDDSYDGDTMDIDAEMTIALQGHNMLGMRPDVIIGADGRRYSDDGIALDGDERIVITARDALVGDDEMPF